MSKQAERIALRVQRGALVPADAMAAAKLRSRDYQIGEVVFAEVKRPRSPGFHRLAHQLGTMVAENIDAFTGMDPHRVLKRLQLEARAECDEIAYQVPGHGMVIQFLPRSLSYESMDETRFRACIRAMCRHLAETYWPDCSAEQIEHMAEIMPSEAA